MHTTWAVMLLFRPFALPMVILPPPLNSGDGSGSSSCVDILHTEVCSLHVQAHDHSPEQLVVQSLFADGFIVYSAIQSNQQSAMKGSGLLLKALHEEIVPGSADSKTGKRCL